MQEVDHFLDTRLGLVNDTMAVGGDPLAIPF